VPQPNQPNGTEWLFPDTSGAMLLKKLIFNHEKTFDLDAYNRILK
jgi:hypothetical protein